MNPVGSVDPKTGDILCNHCYKPDGSVAVELYKDSIYPYWQLCWNCNTVIVEGKSTNWPQLFQKRKDG